eukprot:5597242-Ditylum_brightwellii.AAC.1
MKTCEACAVGKARQKNVPKDSSHEHATKPGERIFIDITTIKGKKDGPEFNPKKQWLIKVDEYSMLKFSNFYKTKNGMVEPTLEQMLRWNQSGRNVLFICCDNTGENKTHEKRS